MKLIDLRLKPSTAILQSFVGEFTAPGRHELCCLKAGGVIELYRLTQGSEADGPDADTATPGCKLIHRTETRSILRCGAVLRFPGEKRDVLAVGADGGALSVLDWEGVARPVRLYIASPLARRAVAGPLPANTLPPIPKAALL